MIETFAGLYLFVVIFLVVLAICWIVLPFALIGTKPLLRQLLTEARRTNELLDRIAPPKLAPAPRPSGSGSALEKLKDFATKPLD